MTAAGCGVATLVNPILGPVACALSAPGVLVVDKLAGAVGDMQDENRNANNKAAFAKETKLVAYLSRQQNEAGFALGVLDRGRNVTEMYIKKVQVLEQMLGKTKKGVDRIGMTASHPPTADSIDDLQYEVDATTGVLQKLGAEYGSAVALLSGGEDSASAQLGAP